MAFIKRITHRIKNVDIYIIFIKIARQKYLPYLLFHRLFTKKRAEHSGLYKNVICDLVRCFMKQIFTEVIPVNKKVTGKSKLIFNLFPLCEILGSISTID